jgi:peptidyl-prolyl cis-trans isomerase C
MLKKKLIIAALFCALSWQALAADYVLLDVNGEKIKYSEVEQIWQSLFPKGEAPPLDGVEDAVLQNVLRGVIGEYLLFAKAMESGIEKEPEVARKLEGARKKVIVDAFLQQKTSTDVTQANLKAEYEKQKANAEVSQEFKASHILVETQEKANEIYSKLKAKGDFAALAKEYSTDKGSSVAGGDLGYFTKEAMVKEFADATEKLKIGEISTPVKSDFGWHIIKLIDKRTKSFPAFEQFRPEIEKQLRTKILHGYIDGLIASAKVKYYDKDGKQLEFSKVMKASEKAK